MGMIIQAVTEDPDFGGEGHMPGTLVVLGAVGVVPKWGDGP